MICMAKRGKIVALSTVAVGVVVLVAAGIAAKERIREEWYLWKLERGNPDGPLQPPRLRVDRPLRLRRCGRRRQGHPQPCPCRAYRTMMGWRGFHAATRGHQHGLRQGLRQGLSGLAHTVTIPL